MAAWKRSGILIVLGILILALPCPAGEETWIEVKSPNFVVISDASEKHARRTARSLEQFRSLLQTALPNLKVDSGAPLIAFALRNENSLKALLPKEMLQKGAATPGGLFAGSTENNFILLRTDAPGEQRYHAIYHEYVHMVMRLNFRYLPLWLNEGFAEFFGYTKIEDGTSGFGMPSAELLQTFQTMSMLPLATLMEITPDSPYYRQRILSTLFYAQSWAFTHYLMIGNRRANAPRLMEFLALLQKDVPEKEAIQRAFGDLKILEQNLQQYVGLRAFSYFSIPSKLSRQEEQYSLRILSPAESLALRGMVLVHVNRKEEAKIVLGQALEMDSRSALAHEAMGILFTRLQKPEEAGKHFAAAVELDSRSYLAHYYAAHSAYQQGDSALMESYLRKALSINPNFAPACRNLSEQLAGKKERLPEALELAIRAASLEPSDTGHRVHVATILILMNRDDEARALADRILASATTDGDRSAARSLLATLKTKQDMKIEERKRAEQLKKELQQTEERNRRDKELEEQIRAQSEARRLQANASPIKTGSSSKAKGLIRSVKCDYPAVMDVVLDSNGTLQRLRANNYYQVRYWAVGAPGKSGFEPCEELEGKSVEIEFLIVSGEEFTGLIQTVAIGQ